MSQIEDELTAALGGELSNLSADDKTFKIYKNSELIFDSEEEGVGTWFQKSFIMVDGQGNSVQSNYPRLLAPVKAIEAIIEDTITENGGFTIEIGGKVWGVKIVRRGAPGMGAIELKNA